MEKRSVTYCPACGQQLIISAQSGKAPIRPNLPIQSGWQPVGRLESSQRLHNAGVVAPEIPTTGDWQKITPVGRLTIQDVTTSIYDAGISGGLVAITALGVCWWFEWPLIISPAAGIATALFRYFGGISLAKSLLEIVETVTQQDINQDGQIGPAEPLPPQTVRVEIKETGEAKRWQFEEFAIEPLKFYHLAQRVINGDSFAERTAIEAGLTQDEFRKLRDKFLIANLARWNHPTRKQQGISLTRGGRAILRAVLDTPLPDIDPDSSDENPLLDSTQQHAAGDYQHINTERR